MTTAQAQDGVLERSAEVARDDDRTIVVSASRSGTELSDLPISISVVGEEELAEQLDFDTNIMRALEFTVPGLAPQRESRSNCSPNIRGRATAILINGVPVNENLRQSTCNQMYQLSPFAVGQVEVIRGGTALYGAGSPGGIINFVTRRAKGEALEVDVVAQTSFNTSETDDSLTTDLYLGGGQDFGGVDYYLGTAYTDGGVGRTPDGGYVPGRMYESFALNGSLGVELAGGELRATGTWYREDYGRQWSADGSQGMTSVRLGSANGLSQRRGTSRIGSGSGPGAMSAIVHPNVAEEARGLHAPMMQMRESISESSWGITARKRAMTYSPPQKGTLRPGLRRSRAEGCGQRSLRPSPTPAAPNLIEKPGSIAEGVFRRHVYDDAIAKVKLDKLRRHHLRDWRRRLEKARALISRSKNGEKRTKPRSASTVNRDMVPLRAALGQVLSLGAPNTDAAWQEALKPHKGADKRRDLYLDRNERKRLLDASDTEAAPFLRALCLLPLRPGALASLRSRDFDKRTRTLTIGKDKHGRPRQITVPQTIADFLAEQVKGKLPTAPIFTRTDGRAWNKDAWKHPVKDAVNAARLPNSVAAYTLRHSIITDLIRDGLPALTVAQLSGTSVAMIERHYGHLVRNDAEQALARLAL